MAALLLSLAILAACDVESTTPGDGPATPTASPAFTTPATSVASSAETFPVIRVVDGDTIIVEVDGVEERLRYIGVDTPESVQPNAPVECYGREAAAENARLVEGKRVELERDISDRDRFGRLLRYVYVVENGQRLFVNLALVAGGYAQVSTFPPDVRHEDAFRAAQREAREEERGLWSACAP